jgi:hypothetical protein
MSENTTRNCPWGYSCDKQWDDLAATAKEDVRFCGACQKEVYWVEDRAELAESVLLNRCVSFRSGLIAGNRQNSDEPGESPEIIETGLPSIENVKDLFDEDDAPN